MKTLQRDKLPIEQLLETHQRLIYKVVHSYCSNISDQEDLIQEIMLHIIKAYPHFDHKVKLSTWIYKIAFNVSITHYRKLQTRQKYMQAMPEKLIAISEPDEYKPNEALQQLQQFITELKPLDKAILIMYLDENSHTEIAQAIGISVSNVGTKINRIKNQLRKKFNHV